MGENQETVGFTKVSSVFKDAFTIYKGVLHQKNTPILFISSYRHRFTLRYQVASQEDVDLLRPLVFLEDESTRTWR